MLKEMMRQCCGPDGDPNFDEMKKFMERHERASKYDAIGWALFFMWVGFAWLTDLGWGIALLGIAAITLVGQAVRAHLGFQIERFWVLVGCLFALAGVWEFYEIKQPLPALLLMLAGLGLLLSNFWRRQ